MDSKKFFFAAVAGFVTLFILGYLLYGIALAGFFEANVGSAAGVIRDPPLMGPITVGNIAMAALLTIIMGKWSATSGFGPGLQVGLVFGFLVTTGFDFIIYGTSNLMNMTALFADIVVATVLYGVTGGVIGVMLARK